MRLAALFYFLCSVYWSPITESSIHNFHSSIVLYFKILVLAFPLEQGIADWKMFIQFISGKFSSTKILYRFSYPTVIRCFGTVTWDIRRISVTSPVVWYRVAFQFSHHKKAAYLDFPKLPPVNHLRTVISAIAPSP